MKINVLAPAKINLTLDITGRTDNGYHYVDMIMQTISLYDEISVEIIEGESGIFLSCSNKDIPTDSSNTAYKAVKYYLEKINRNDVLVKININKNIPSQAGLAGGSTDASGVIYALNSYFNDILTSEEMLAICAKIGADVPFCLYGGTTHSTGIGTTLKKINSIPDCFIVLVKPEINISTKLAYELSDKKGYSKKVHSDEVIKFIDNKDIKNIAKNLYNDFEEVLIIEEINNIKQSMLNTNAVGAVMSGSGSTVYAIFTDENDAENCADIFKKQYKDVYLARPINCGCKIVK